MLQIAHNNSALVDLFWFFQLEAIAMRVVNFTISSRLYLAKPRETI